MTLPIIPLFLKQLGGNDQLIGLMVGIFTFSALIIRPPLFLVKLPIYSVALQSIYHLPFLL